MTDSGRSGRVGYREIAKELRRLIDSGELPPGGKVPGENELISRFGVAQATARRALDALKNEGLIVAKRGSGTFVREFKPIKRVSPDRMRSTWGSGVSMWNADVGTRPRTENTTVGVEDPPALIAEKLGLDEGAQVLVRRRRFTVDDKPVQLATSYYPAALVAGSAITEINTGEGGTYARLTELGHEPVKFVEELQARMPRAAESEALELAQGTPVILIVRTAFTANDLPVEVNEMTLDSHAYVVAYRFTSQG